MSGQLCRIPLLVMALICFASAGQAAVTITAEESGGDVVFSTCGGSLNLSGSLGKTDTSGGAFIFPSSKDVVAGLAPGNVDADQHNVSMTYPADFGTGGIAGPTSGYGGLVGILGNNVIVPDEYTSNNPLGVAAMTFSGATFASLGLTPGSYTWSWSSDSITLNVGSAPPCLTWHLQGVIANGPMDEPADVYGDGTTNYNVTGSFNYDAANNVYSGINITTPYYNYTDANLAAFFVQDAQHLRLIAGSDGMLLSFLNDLTNAGGTVTLRTGFTSGDCIVSECGSVENTIATGGGIYYMAGAVTTTVAVTIDAVLDIQSTYLHPRHDGRDPNPSTPGGMNPNDAIPVVVFGASTLVGDSEDLDTDLIDPATLAFGPGMGGISPSHPPEFNLDEDSDGLDDARFRFLMSDAAFDSVTCTDSSGTLTGELTTGESFEGSDTFISDCNASCH